jgi:hypothetical protein
VIRRYCALELVRSITRLRTMEPVEARRVVLLVLPVLALIVGCSGSGAQPTVAAHPSVTSSIRAPVGPLAPSRSSAGDCTGEAIDYAASAHGRASASDALAAYLRDNRRQFPQRGWALGSSSGALTTFVAGRSNIETTKLSDGSWVVTGYSACR